MRILITGSRHWYNSTLIRNVLRTLLEDKQIEPFDALVIHGGAAGADILSGEVAKIMGIHTAEVKALWNRYGKAAGPMRNYAMLKLLNPDMVIAFHDDLANSKGTADCVKKAMRMGISVRHYTQKGKIDPPLL